jgi:hypothetical protein
MLLLVFLNGDSNKIIYLTILLISKYEFKR